jgi:23S rRNA (adenine2503-C2)-methyltransferase
VTGPRSLYDLTGPELAALAAEAGEPAYRGRQLVHWLDRRRVVDPLAMTDLPAGFRERLAERFTGSGLTLDRHQTGDGGWTHKFLFRLAGGDGVESVLMFYPAAGRGVPTESDEQDHDWEGGRVGRATVCISTQAGCAMGCSFCATGQFGFTRNLSTGEVVEQVARVWAMLPVLRPRADAPDHLTNVVFMGMGEPFANQTATWAAAWRLHQGLGLSARAVTISTVGLVPGIRRAAAEPLAVNLAVSIHAPDDELRSRLVPVNRTWPIAELLAAVGDYVRATRRRVSFEYALMHGVNDDPEQGRRLGRLLAPLRVPGSGGHAAHVNLIPYNPTPGSGFAPPSRTAARRFRDAVASTGVPVSIRATRGVGIDAACGQLRTTAGRPGRTVLPLVAAGGSGGLKERSGSPPGIRGSDRSEEGSGGREVGRSRAPDGLRNDEAAPGDGGATREAGAPGGGGPPTVSVKGRPV